MESNHLESPEENDTTSPSQQVSNDTATQNGKNVQNEMSVKNGSNEKDKNDLTEDVPNITFNHNSNVSFAALPSPPIMQPLQPILPMHPTIPIPGMMDPSFAAMPIHGGMPMGGMHIGGVPNLPQFAPIYPMNHQIPDINLNIGGGIPGMPPIPSMPFGLQPHPFQPTPFHPTPFDANPVNPVNGKNNNNKGGDAVPTLNSISRQTQNQYFCRTRQQLEMLDTYKAGTPLTNNKENENKTTNNNNNSEQQLQEKIKQLQSLQQQHLQLTAGQPFPHPLSKIDENAIQKNVIPNGSLFPNLLTQSHLAQLQQKSNTNPNPNPNPNPTPSQQQQQQQPQQQPTIIPLPNPNTFNFPVIKIEPQHYPHLAPVVSTQNGNYPMIPNQNVLNMNNATSNVKYNLVQVPFGPIYNPQVIHQRYPYAILYYPIVAGFRNVDQNLG